MDITVEALKLRRRELEIAQLPSQDTSAMTNPQDYLSEDYRFTADLLRAHSKLDDPALFRAVCSNNLNIVLAALAIAETVAAAYEENSAA